MAPVRSRSPSCFTARLGPDAPRRATTSSESSHRSAAGSDNFYDLDPPLRIPTRRCLHDYPVVAYLQDNTPLHERMDVIVLVFDLMPERRAANLAALDDLRAWPAVPWVLQLNKADVVGRMSDTDAIQLADPQVTAWSTLETVATDGIGVDRVLAAALDAALAIP